MMSGWGHVADMIGRMKANQDLRKRNKYTPGSQRHKHIATKHHSKETPEEKEVLKQKHLRRLKYNRFTKILAIILTIILTPLAMYLFYLLMVLILS
jgi:hypothetical protein